jgi:hypothetical protein
MKLEGKPPVAAMCVGQVGNLLPHVVVPAVMAQHLIPLWKLTAGEAGVMASSFAVGYMLAVPVLTTLTDRMDARLVARRLIGQRPRDTDIPPFRGWTDLRPAHLGYCRHGLRWSVHAGSQGSHRSPRQNGAFTQRYPLRGLLLSRCRPFVSGRAARC